MGCRMGIRSWCVAGLCSLYFMFSAVAIAQQAAAHSLITQPVDETHLVTLRGNTHPLALPQFDIGQAPPDLPLNRMLLVLKRSDQQEHALRTLLDSQQDKNSSSYHRWLTPDEFGAAYGPSDQDLQTVTNWLQSHGLQVNSISHGKTVIEFSGVESQVEAAFNTQIHSYMLPNGEQHWANASDPQIPAALLPAVAGVRSLNNFPVQHFSQLAGVFSRNKATGQITPVNPQITFPGGQCGVTPNCYGLGPYDFATIYDVLNSWNAATPIDGTGQTIAIVGETDINPQDVTAFRSFFGLPAYGQPGGPALNIIHSGPAPGILTDGEESEADLDVEWSGGVAKGASVDFVVAQSTETTQGIDLSALYIVDNNLAPVMSESYGQCELRIGTTGNQFFNTLWEQAAAQGITVMLSTGDGSSAGCDNFDAGGPATLGLAVSGFASTPFNVAVGGTDFNDLTTYATYWNTTNTTTTQASAKSYIPETTWDDNCTNPVFGTLLGLSNNAETNCNNSQLVNVGFVNIVGGSGGHSSCISSDGVNPSSCTGGYPKPSWQTLPGTDNVRDLPDVSLFAASGSPSGAFYMICEADAVNNFGSCSSSTSSSLLMGIGGTSASSPAFAGIMALVNQKMQARQGNANFVLYKLAQLHPTVFHDVTTGTIEVPCQTGSPNCTTSRTGDQFGILNGYNTAAGYDLATGIGSVDVGLLLQNWSSANFRPSLTTLALNPTTSLTHGQSVNVTASVAPSTGSGTPTGNVSLLASTGLPAGTFTLANGQISGTTNLLPGGTYTVTAHYGGDTTFGGSDSTPVSVTVGKENSSTQLQLETFDFQGNLISSNASTAVYGSPYFLRINVLNGAGTACEGSTGLPLFSCPTGSVNLSANGSPLDAGTYPLNSLGSTHDLNIQLPGGSDAVQAQFTGDNSFNASFKTATLNIMPAPTNTIPPPGSSCCYRVGDQFNGAALVQSQSSGATPSGTLTFYANGTPIPGTVTYSSNPPSGSPPTVSYSGSFSSSSSPFTGPGTYNITVKYSGDTNYQPSTSSATAFNVTFLIPTVNLQVSPSTVNAGSATTLIATVLGQSPTIAPTGTFSFFQPIFGAATLPGAVSYTTITDPNTGNLDLQGRLTVHPNFTTVYGVNYSGDADYPTAGTCCATSVTVNGNDFVLSAQQSSQTVSAGFSAFYPVIVGLQSNTSPVSFGANACSGLPAETTCSISPDPTANTTIVNLVISTTAPHSVPGAKASGYRSQLFWVAGSMLPFAAILLIGYRRSGSKRPPWRLLFTLLLALDMGCGGGGSSNGGGGGGGGGAPPSAPTNLTATAASYNQIDLNWSQPTTTTGFTIYRGTTSGFTPSLSNQVVSIGPGYAPSYMDIPLAPSTTYYYLVKATNTSGASAPSNQASATTQALDPGTPAGTYNITVTGTSGAISHSVNLTLVVQ